jgi:hypothetical protein
MLQKDIKKRKKEVVYKIKQRTNTPEFLPANHFFIRRLKKAICHVAISLGGAKK